MSKSFSDIPLSLLKDCLVQIIFLIELGHFKTTGLQHSVIIIYLQELDFSPQANVGDSGKRRKKVFFSRQKP